MINKKIREEILTPHSRMSSKTAMAIRKALDYIEISKDKWVEIPDDKYLMDVILESADINKIKLEVEGNQIRHAKN